MLLPNRLTEQNAEKLIKNILSYKVLIPKYSKKPFIVATLKISGFVGEPLLNKKFQEIVLTLIKKFKSAGRRVVVFTNGSSLGNNFIRKNIVLADSIHISLDAGSDKTFRKLRNPPDSISYKKTLSNIGLLCRMRDRKKLDSQIGVGFIINKDNFKEIYKAAKDAKRIGADFIRYKFDITGSSILLKKEDQMANLLLDQSFLLEDRNFNVFLTKTEEGGTITPKNSACYTQYFWGTVGADGNMYPCDHNTINNCPDFGNIIDNSLEKIWKSKQRRDARKYIPKICVLCSPFASRINPFIEKINKLKKKYGWMKLEKWRKQILAN